MAREKLRLALLLALALALVLGPRSFTCPQHQIFAEWLEKKAVTPPPEEWLATSLLWRAQRLGLPYPLHQKAVRPYLPKGPKEGCHEEMYTAWRAADLFEKMAKQAEKSKTVDWDKEGDYDMLLSLWMERLRQQGWPEDANSAQNFAVEIYSKQMEDPEVFRAMAEAAPLDERLQEEMESVMSSVDDARKTNRKKFPVETLKTFDSLFVGHSNHHVQNPFQLWEDVTLAIRKRFKGKCKRPLYNDVGLFHEKDVAMDLLDGSKTAPEGHFSLIAVLHVVLDATGFQRLQKLLKPGGVLIWNTWWRGKGEHPGEVPDMKRLGFEKLKDEELPLSYVTSPWQESGFTYRICYARRAGKGGGGFR